MTKQEQTSSLIGPEESRSIMGELRYGASRRDVLAMLAAGGMQATLAGSLASTALAAQAAAPRKGGRIKVAGATAALSDKLDPA